MVMLLEFPATKGLVGDTAVMCGGHRSDSSQSCAWQNVAEISNNSMTAKGCGHPIAPPNLPKSLRMGAFLSWVGCESGARSGSRELYPDSRS